MSDNPFAPVPPEPEDDKPETISSIAESDRKDFEDTQRRSRERVKRFQTKHRKTLFFSVLFGAAVAFACAWYMERVLTPSTWIIALSGGASAFVIVARQWGPFLGALVYTAVSIGSAGPVYGDFEILQAWGHLLLALPILATGMILGMASNSLAQD
jgi:hypothetical protein